MCNPFRLALPPALTAIALFVAAAPLCAQTCEWASGFHLRGMDDEVRASTVFDDGSGPALYVGGDFETADDIGVNHIAKWDGTAWTPLGAGMNSWVNALTVHDDGSGPALYAGGNFTTAGGVAASYIAKWDGTAWTPLGAGMNNGVFALTVHDDGSGPALYAGGNFTTAGGVAASYIAKWDGTAWTPLGAGMNNDVFALTVHDDGSGPALYAGGNFTTAGGIAASKIAKWDGTAWTPLGTGINGRVYALTVHDDGSGPALYAGGSFTTAGGVAASRIAKWDGTAWTPLGAGMNNGVSALTVHDDGSGPALYAGGNFTTAGGIIANRIAEWDGSAWTPLATGMNSAVYALTVHDDGSGPALYAGGNFNTAGGVTANRIAKWDGTAWTPLATGIGRFVVHALTMYDDGSGTALYAGGEFAFAGGLASANIARYVCSPSPPGFSKSFMPDSIDFGAFSTLAFTIDNTGNPMEVDNLAFVDNLPDGMVIRNPPGVVNDCGGLLTADAGTSLISLSGGTVAAGSTCNIQVDVDAACGTHVNTTEDLTSDAGNSGTATATLTVNCVTLGLTKVESGDPVPLTGQLIYTITIDNDGPSPATDLLLSEVLTLPANVTVDSITPSEGTSYVPPDGASGTWTVPALDAGTDATLVVVLTVAAEAPTGTDVICDTLTVMAVNEPNVGDTSVSECTSVVPDVIFADGFESGDTSAWSL